MNKSSKASHILSHPKEKRATQAILVEKTTCFDGISEYEQYFTPEWAAFELISRFFSSLNSKDFVIEPSCGTGSFLKSIPENVPAIGIEIDKKLAEEAQNNSGRTVICGDFRTVEIPQSPSVILGNPPFRMETFDGFLDRAKQLLPKNGQCGFILPASAFQTPSRVLRWNEDWSMESSFLPRTLFHNLRSPLTFVLFTKDKLQKLHGFILYQETDCVSKMKGKLLLAKGMPGKICWRSLIEEALKECGGSGKLSDIYSIIEPRRHTKNRWWKEKVRQQLQKNFTKVEKGVYAL